MIRTGVVLLAIVSVVVAAAASCGQTQHLQGKNLYLTHCNNCHLEEGQGLRQLIPPLAGSDYLAERPDDVVRGIRNGMNGPMEVNGVIYNHPMPAYPELSETQIVNVVNYVNTAWGNDYPLVTITEVRDWLAAGDE